MLDFAYYPGCTLKTTAKHFELSALEVCKILNIGMSELPRWNCCGTVFSLSEDDLMHNLAPIRNLIRVEEMGKSEMVALCSMCYNTIKRANAFILADESRLKTINDFMYKESHKYEGSVKVLHLLEVLRDRIGFERIKKYVKKPLTGLKVAPYYGCALLRPEGAGIDEADNPHIMGDLLRALGAEVIEFTADRECCGSYHVVSKPELVYMRASNILDRVIEEGAEALVLSCPLCDFNLDDKQKDIIEKDTSRKPVPIFYFTQLMALAFGIEKEKLGFENHAISPTPLLKEKNLI